MQYKNRNQSRGMHFLFFLISKALPIGLTDADLKAMKSCNETMSEVTKGLAKETLQIPSRFDPLTLTLGDIQSYLDCFIMREQKEKLLKEVTGLTCQNATKDELLPFLEKVNKFCYSYESWCRMILQLYVRFSERPENIKNLKNELTSSLGKLHHKSAITGGDTQVDAGFFQRLFGGGANKELEEGSYSDFLETTSSLLEHFKRFDDHILHSIFTKDWVHRVLDEAKKVCAKVNEANKHLLGSSGSDEDLSTNIKNEDEAPENPASSPQNTDTQDDPQR